MTSHSKNFYVRLSAFVTQINRIRMGQHLQVEAQTFIFQPPPPLGIIKIGLVFDEGRQNGKILTGV